MKLEINSYLHLYFVTPDKSSGIKSASVGLTRYSRFEREDFSQDISTSLDMTGLFMRYFFSGGAYGNTKTTHRLFE